MRRPRGLLLSVEAVRWDRNKVKHCRPVGLQVSIRAASHVWWQYASIRTDVVLNVTNGRWWPMFRRKKPGFSGWSDSLSAHLIDFRTWYFEHGTLNMVLLVYLVRISFSFLFSFFHLSDGACFLPSI
jgi:hypothetical protein